MMLPFDPESVCPKCESNYQPTIKHVGLGVSDYIARACKVCGYAWKEAPLDGVAPL